MLVIPAIDLLQGKCVRLYQGDYSKQTTYVEDPVGQSLKFQAARFSRLHVVDLEGARLGSGKNRDAIGRIIRVLRIPVQVGGGVRSCKDVSELLELGAKYVVLGTVVLKEPERVNEWMRKWGNRLFIVSLDLRGGQLQSEGWTEQSRAGLDEVIQRCADWGIAQVICTDVESDGTMEQPNFATYTQLLKELPVGTFLIAAGGICHPEHLSRLKQIGVGGAIVGRAFYEGKIPWEKLVDAG